MKNKLIVISLIVVLTLSSITFSNSSYFEGFKIVNLTIDSAPVVSDVPAVVLNGRAMVPIKVIAESLGSEVTWNGNTYTVSITKPQTNVAKSDDLLLIKEYAEIADLFNTLENFRDTINMAYDYYWIATDAKGTSSETETLEELIERFEYCGERYNKILGYVDSFNASYKFESTRTAISLMYGILDDYHSALSKYEIVVLDLINYFTYNTHKTPNYAAIRDEVSTIINDTGLDAYTYYGEYIYKVIGY